MASFVYDRGIMWRAPLLLVALAFLASWGCSGGSGDGAVFDADASTEGGEGDTWVRYQEGSTCENEIESYLVLVRDAGDSGAFSSGQLFEIDCETGEEAQRVIDAQLIKSYKQATSRVAFQGMIFTSVTGTVTDAGPAERYSGAYCVVDDEAYTGFDARLVVVKEVEQNAEGIIAIDTYSHAIWSGDGNAYYNSGTGSEYSVAAADGVLRYSNADLAPSNVTIDTNAEAAEEAGYLVGQIEYSTGTSYSAYCAVDW